MAVQFHLKTVVFGFGFKTVTALKQNVNELNAKIRQINAHSQCQIYYWRRLEDQHMKCHHMI